MHTKPPMTPNEKALLKLEIAYLHAKLNALFDEESAVRTLAGWFFPHNSEENIDFTRKVIMHCTGAKYRTDIAVHLYHELGFTLEEIGKFVGKSRQTVSSIVKKKVPDIQKSTGLPPFSEQTFIDLRKALDDKKEQMENFGFRAKNSII